MPSAELIAGIEGYLHLRASADQHDGGFAAGCFGEDVPAAGSPVGGGIAGGIAAVKDRYVLP